MGKYIKKTKKTQKTQTTGLLFFQPWHVMDGSRRDTSLQEDFVYHTKWTNKYEAFGLMTVCTKFPNMQATKVCFVYI
jgi:hypothetical protein